MEFGQAGVDQPVDRNPHEDGEGRLLRLGYCKDPGQPDDPVLADADYQPSLPWFVYRHTQARVHLSVMRRFSRHLARHAETGVTGESGSR